MKPTAVILLAIFSICAAEILDYRLVLAPYAAQPKPCTEAGPFCATCESLVVCIDQNGTWATTSLGPCTAPTYCAHGKCTTDYDPFCSGTADMDFPCEQVGIFPDPFYCNRFYLCVNGAQGLEVYPNDCTAGFGYDVATDLCDKKLNGDKCPDPVAPDDYPVPLCQFLGDSAPLKGNPAMYYVCEQMAVNGVDVLYPHIFICPGDETYNSYGCSSGSGRGGDDGSSNGNSGGNGNGNGNGGGQLITPPPYGGNGNGNGDGPVTTPPPF